MTQEQYPNGRKAQRFPSDQGLVATSKRGQIGATWWSRRYVDVMESIESGGRLARGKAYARAGNIIDQHVEPGRIRATVQGSENRPYTVTIEQDVFDSRERALLFHAIAQQPFVVSSLMAGNLPSELEAMATEVGLNLFPHNSSDLRFSCTCPDWGDPCKHGAATIYLFAERLDAAPFNVLTVRGIDRTDLIGEILQRNNEIPGVIVPGPPSDTTGLSQESANVATSGREGDEDRELGNFYRATEDLPLPGSGHGELSPLEILDHTQLDRAASSITFWLTPFYTALAENERP